MEEDPLKKDWGNWSPFHSLLVRYLVTGVIRYPKWETGTKDERPVRLQSSATQLHSSDLRRGKVSLFPAKVSRRSRIFRILRFYNSLCFSLSPQNSQWSMLIWHLVPSPPLPSIILVPCFPSPNRLKRMKINLNLKAIVGEPGRRTKAEVIKSANVRVMMGSVDPCSLADDWYQLLW